MKLPWRRAAVTTILVAALVGVAGAGTAAASSQWEGGSPLSSQWDGATTNSSQWE